MLFHGVNGILRRFPYACLKVNNLVAEIRAAEATPSAMEGLKEVLR